MNRLFNIHDDARGAVAVGELAETIVHGTSAFDALLGTIDSFVEHYRVHFTVQFGELDTNATTLKSRMLSVQIGWLTSELLVIR